LYRKRRNAFLDSFLAVVSERAKMAGFTKNHLLFFALLKFGILYSNWIHFMASHEMGLGEGFTKKVIDIQHNY
jgi:hypothetical protein